MTHWIFGYGSLICPDSRARTGLTGTAKPAILSGYERHWSVPVEYADVSVLGIQEGTPEQEVGGVLFALDEAAFARFDAREAEYRRVPLDPARLRPVLHEPLPEENCWLYLPHPEDSPHPIPQSYLDVILRGCLTISEEFARHFLAHTSRWKPYLADRQAPVYPRPLKPEHQHVLPTIDRLLADHERILK